MEKYKINKMKCTIQDIKLSNNIEAIMNLIKDTFKDEEAFVLLKERDKVIVRKYSNNNIDFKNNEFTNIKMLIDIRVFNSNKELYLTNYKNELIGSITEDYNTSGIEYDTYDEDYILWGKVIKLFDNYIELKDDKTATIQIPSFEGVKIGDLICIKVRNYISPNSENGIPNIIHSRTIDFVVKGDK